MARNVVLLFFCACASLGGSRGVLAETSLNWEEQCATLACASCANTTQCLWCQSTGLCTSSTVNQTCEAGWCSGDNCAEVCAAPCTAGIWPCSDSNVGMLLLIVVYGAILMCGAKLISDGSELLLELFPNWATVIGALLLPVLGAVPDACIIIMSAMGDPAVAQQQVAVGVGTLAGSTIMLLTLAWAASFCVGRCDLNEFGEAIDQRCTRFDPMHQGVSVDVDTAVNARIMVVTSFAYLIVQAVAFAYLADPTGATARRIEDKCALAGFVVCVLLLICYCVYQMWVPKLALKRKSRLEKQRMQRMLALRALHVLQSSPGFANVLQANQTDTLHSRALHIGLKWKRRALEQAGIPVPLSAVENSDERQPLLGDARAAERGQQPSLQEHAEEEQDEGAEDVREHFKKFLLKSAVLMLVGTAVVAIFSDPMVAVISDFASHNSISAFYISFIVTPFCSNASELLSSLVFASKKRKENASLTFSQLYGAATMNNTLCLGIFYALIYFKGLTWTFSAETVVIMLVTIVVGLISSFKTNFRLIYALPVLLLYPLSLGVVVALEKLANWT